MRFYRWQPTQDLAELQLQVNRAFGEMLGWAARGPEGGRAAGWAPPMDVAESDEAFVLRLDVPGLRQDQIDVTLEDNLLVVRGAKPPLEAADNTVVHRNECPAGAFYRSFPLPATADPAQVKAQLRDGVLRVQIGKLAEATPRKITVEAQ